MAAMTARDFADEVVEPTIREFIEIPDRRRGYLACLVSYHAGDYLSPTASADAKAALGLPFVALYRMCNTAKHREATHGKAVPMAAGSDTERPVSGFGSLWADFRFDDRGGRHIEYDGRQYDMLALCLIAVRHYAEEYPDDLRDSTVTRFHYDTRAYPAV